MQADKTASLNERERLKERQEADARQKARDQERAARKAPDVKIYELTVAKAGEPGLPPPLGETNTVTANKLPAGPLPTPVGSANVTPTPPSMPPGVDPMLDETERILEDYISLLSTNQVLIAK
jgi:hypothetical protein